MNPVKIMVLCGGKFAFPALQLMALEKHLTGIAIGGGDSDSISILQKESKKTGLPFRHFPTNKSLANLREWIDSVNPDLIFSICFPFLIAENILNTRPGKFINFHPGPLPEYRGPMPVFEVLRSREKETALSVHIMDGKYDNGPIILREPVVISSDETFGSLALKLSDRAAQSALNIAHMFQFGTQIPACEQPEENARYFPKPEPRDTLIRWEHMHAEEILALVNACNPWKQGAAVHAGMQTITISHATLNNAIHNHLQPGTILELSKEKGLSIACIEGRILEVDTVCLNEGVFPGWKLNKLGFKQNMILQ